MIEDGQPREQAMTTALRAMRGMSSDFERRSVLEAAADAGIAVPDGEYLAAVDATDSVNLLARADSAMYKAKHSTVSRVAFYRPPPGERPVFNRAVTLRDSWARPAAGAKRGGGGHARFRRWRLARLAAGVPDQADRGHRTPDGADAAGIG